MARTAITYEQIVRTGLESVGQAAVADGNKFSNDGRMFLRVLNEDASSINVTIQTPVTVDGLAVTDLVVAVPAGEARDIGPFPPAIYNQTDGMVYVDYSAVTDITVTLFRL